jgi:Na+/phosphate symporter
MIVLNVLYWVGLLGAAAAVVIYFMQIARFRKWVRLVTGAGLFFTGLGLAEASVAMHVMGTDMERAVPNAVTVAALLAAVYFQSVAALRSRQARASEAVAAQPSEAT